MAAYGLYSHIQSNRRRSIVLLAGLFLLVYVLVYAGALVAEALSVNADIDALMQLAWTDLLQAAPLATIGTALWVVIAYYFHQNMIDALTGGREVTRAEEPRLYNLLENLCISRGITMPKLKVMESDALNAFATGMNDKQYSITVTTGLLDRLDDAEIEGVLGHELTHIRNGDVRMMVVAVIIAGVISFFAELVFRLWFYNGFSFRSRSDDRRGGGAGLRHPDRRRAHCGRLFPVVRHSAGAVALARIPRRCRLGRTHQESRRHDLGAAQDRGPRRIAGRDLGGDGNVRRQPARKDSASCSIPIRASTAGSRRWSSSPAATIPARWRCRRSKKARRTTIDPNHRRRAGRGARRRTNSSEAEGASPGSSSNSSAGPWGPHSGGTSQSGHN